MNFLANENFPRDAVRALGHDVAGSSAQLAAHVCAAVASRTDWAGHFSVVEPTRIRMRPLPTPGQP